jgi:7-cyano-7-deazaguanine synthase
MRITVVPNRNAIMLSVAFGIARAEGATRVYAGMHAGDHAIYPDCRAEFVEAFATAMYLANDDLDPDKQPALIAPFISMTKADIAREGSSLNVPYNLTWSCYKGGNLHCGTCGTCVERKEAFELANVQDPTMYEN